MSRFAVSAVRKLRVAAADADRTDLAAHQSLVTLRGLALQHFDESCEVAKHPDRFTPRHALDLVRDPGFKLLVQDIEDGMSRCAKSKAFAYGLQLMLTPQPGHNNAALTKEPPVQYGEKLKMETLWGRMFDSWYYMLEALKGEFRVHPVHGRVVLIEPAALYEFVRRMLLQSGIKLELTPDLETAFHNPFSPKEMMRATVDVATQYVTAVHAKNSHKKRPVEDAVHEEEDEDMQQGAAEVKRRKAEGAAVA